MRWSACESTWVSQIVVTLPRLNPSQLPCVGKCASSKRARPMHSIWDSKSGISSTRSVLIVHVSFIPTAYQNVWNASRFTRTVSNELSEYEQEHCIFREHKVAVAP